MSVTRRIAVKLPEYDDFKFFPENGSNDCASFYTHGEKYPSGGFTGQRWSIIKGIPTLFRADDHDRRYQQTIDAAEWININSRPEERRLACYRIIALNTGDCYLSQMFSSFGDVGVYPADNRAKLLINTRAFNADHPYLPRRVVEEGANVRITEVEIHRGPLSQYSRVKLGRNYLFSNIAKHRAKLAGFDDGLMLDEHGDVSELSVSNLILLEDHRLVSPWGNSSPLDGITKRTIATIGQEMFGLEYAEERVPVDRLKSIRGAMITGTAIGAILVRRFVAADGQLVWELTDREAEERLKVIGQTYWHLLNGENPGYHPEWFTPVPGEILTLAEPLVQVP